MICARRLTFGSEWAACSMKSLTSWIRHGLRKFLKAAESLQLIYPVAEISPTQLKSVTLPMMSASVGRSAS
jgi:hypothetical protein